MADAGFRLLVAEPELIVGAVDTPPTPLRDTARRLVRQALVEALAARFGCPPAELAVLTTPGQAPRLAGAGQVGLSFAHEPGCSLFAARRDGPVGVDLLRLPEIPDWLAEIPALARDYLGPAVAGRLAALPIAARAAAFTDAWTRHEAALKCLGLGLEEWQPALVQRLGACRVHRLALPPGLVGALAVDAGTGGLVA